MSPAAIQHGGVRWSPVVLREMATTAEVSGQLVPNEDRTARLGAPAQARVLRVHVQVGDRVARGQPLVTLQSAEASTARADYDKAAADLSARRAAAVYARTARERAERLLAAKAIARQDLERAQADDELARSELARASAEVARTRATLAQLGVSSAAALASGLMVVRSPLAGVVLSRDAAPGTVADAGAALVTVSDPSTLWLDLAITEQAVSALSRGARVRFTVPAFPTDTFEARVVSIGGAFNAETRMLPVRAIVQNAPSKTGPKTGKLRAQMFATARIEGAERRASVAVPESAVMLLDEKPVVFVVRANSDGEPNGPVRFERREIVRGGTSGGVVQIISGVKAGELVVTDGAFAVKSEFSRTKLAEG